MKVDCPRIGQTLILGFRYFKKKELKQQHYSIFAKDFHYLLMEILSENDVIKLFSRCAN